jgi:hypothetical protein
VLSGPAGGKPKLMLAGAGNFPEIANFYYEAVVKRASALVRNPIDRGIRTGEFRSMNIDHAAHVLIAPVVILAVSRHSVPGYLAAQSLKLRKNFDDRFCAESFMQFRLLQPQSMRGRFAPAMKAISPFASAEKWCHAMWGSVQPREKGRISHGSIPETCNAKAIVRARKLPSRMPRSPARGRATIHRGCADCARDPTEELRARGCCGADRTAWLDGWAHRRNRADAALPAGTVCRMVSRSSPNRVI